MKDEQPTIPRPVVRGRVVELEIALARLCAISGTVALMTRNLPPGVLWEFHAATEGGRETLGGRFCRR